MSLSKKGVICESHQEQEEFISNFCTTKVTANIYLFKVINRNTRKKCEICSKLTIKTSERLHDGLFLP